MAEYYPLISRAVAGLRTGTPASRRAIYDRARQALIGQLRTMDPPIPEEAITRETVALDEAIARVEADLLPPAPPAEPVVAAAPPSSTPAARPAPLPRPTTSAATAEGVKPKPAPPRPERPRPSPRPALPSLRPSTTRPVAPGAERAVSPAPVEAAGSDTAPKSVEPKISPPEPQTAAPSFPTATALKVETAEALERGPMPPAFSVTDEDRAGVKSQRAHVKDGADDRTRDETLRPAAPRPVEKKRPNLRVGIVALAALAAVVAIAFTAWRLRDDPQDLSRVPIAAKSAEPVVGKIVERADGSAAAPPSTSGPAAVSEQGSAAAPDAGASPPAAVATPPATSQPPAETAVPVAYKAAVLVDAPDLPEKVKTFVGTVVWQKETVTQGQDQPIGDAIRADIDVPEANVRLVMQIRRNTEAQLPASHTIELKYTVAADSALGNVKQINVPQMREEDRPTGDPLAGIPVTIADNYFLVGLMRGDSEARNMELLRSRGWIDIPMLLANGKASKVTFEKGASGNRVFNEVLDGWKNVQN